MSTLYLEGSVPCPIPRALTRRTGRSCGPNTHGPLDLSVPQFPLQFQRGNKSLASMCGTVAGAQMAAVVLLHSGILNGASSTRICPRCVSDSGTTVAATLTIAIKS